MQAIFKVYLKINLMSSTIYPFLSNQN